MDAREMTVKWVRGPLVVHMYRMQKETMTVQAPLFQGRTKMLRQDMAEGKVTLRIHQVQLSDSGQYTCYFQAGRFYSEASFDLQVAEHPKRPFSVIGSAQPIQAKQGEEVTLSCELSPKMDARHMTVNWLRNQTLVHRYPIGEKLEESQGSEIQGRTELLKCDMAEGKVTLKMQQVRISDSGPYTCQFQSPNCHSEAHMEQQVAENLPTSQKDLPVMIVAVFLVVFTGSILVVYFFHKTKLQRTRAEIIPLHLAPEGGQKSSKDPSSSPGNCQILLRPPAIESFSPELVDVIKDAGGVSRENGCCECISGTSFLPVPGDPIVEFQAPLCAVRARMRREEGLVHPPNFRPPHPPRTSTGMEPERLGAGRCVQDLK
ncbi:butyrophilin subfamily 1 member A1-like [Trichosurus vulpecula]|uniref:butyrophilin subfamily 1 member A1-like n=1 Tax=Trichosurus vulpecula TaxID=9337 RepID=UPI00186B22A7|nr:butyrophilin subfamily 1 member A1-like [Trichosurus vulpecula]